MDQNVEFSHCYYLTAGEAGAQSAMPLTLLVQRVIEVATEHANALGIGYDTLSCHGIAWVLSRISIAMKRYPRINETYCLTTWIESYNRRFCDRCFVVADGDGNEIGHIRTMWTAIDVRRRCVADLTAFEKEAFPVSARECPVDRTPHMAPVSDAASVQDYTFRYCDIDFNRHVNSVRYLALVLNHWTMDHFDNNTIRRIDIAYCRECYFGETVQLKVFTHEHISDCEITRDGARAVSLRIHWAPRS